MTDKPKPSASSKRAGKAGSGASSTKGQGAGTRQSGDNDKEADYSFLSPPIQLDEMGRLAHYRVLKVLGAGGMGTVFMAEDTKLHRIVALKVMLASVAKKAVARERFMHEARATAKIEHDHIVTIYEVNEANGVPFLAMQVLKGMNLDEWLKAGKSLNVPQIMRIGKEIAKGLAAAHAQDLMHRDIKPSNIWLDASNKGRVKILDFGLARQTNDETHLTQEGLIIGTPAYMSPEQARGVNVDARSDLFSLGCVLYRLCVGRLPFAGQDAMSMLLSITTAEPMPISQLNAQIPPKFAALVHQLLAKKPEDRPASARAVVQTIQDLEREWINETRPNTGFTPTPPRRSSAAPKVDESLEESMITDLELIDDQEEEREPPRSRGWIFGCLGGIVIAAMSFICLIVFGFSVNQGTLIVTGEDREARAFLETNGLTVFDHNKKATLVKGSGEHRLPSGGYQVKLEGLPTWHQVEPLHFNVTRDETVEVKLRLRPRRPAVVLVTADNARKLQDEWAAFLRMQVIEENKLGAKMVLIPPGIFEMGSTADILRFKGEPFGKKFDKKPSAPSFFRVMSACSSCSGVLICRTG